MPEDLEDLVQVHPPLEHRMALERMAEMSALLVLALEDRSGPGIVPGKLYEYAGTGVPLLVCAPASYEVRRLAEDREVGLGGWSHDEIVSAMRCLEDFAVDDEGRRSLSREAAARQLSREFLLLGRATAPPSSAG